MSSILDTRLCVSYSPAEFAATSAGLRTPPPLREPPDRYMPLVFDPVFPSHVPDRALFVLVAEHDPTGSAFVLYDGAASARIEVMVPVYDQHPAEFRLAASLIVPDAGAICDWTDEPLHVLAPDGPSHWHLQFLPWIEEGADGWRRMLALAPAG